MDTIRTLEGNLVPVSLSDESNLWAYDSFYIADIFSTDQHCCKCSRKITYVYVVKNPKFGTAHVGMECIRSVLFDAALKSAMNEFHTASAKINQNRLKTRISRIRSKIPMGFLEVLKVNTKKGPVMVKSALEHLENKLQLRVFLSSYEIEILQRLEEKV